MRLIAQHSTVAPCSMKSFAGSPTTVTVGLTGALRRPAVSRAKSASISAPLRVNMSVRFSTRRTAMPVVNFVCSAPRTAMGLSSLSYSAWPGASEAMADARSGVGMTSDAILTVSSDDLSHRIGKISER